MTPVVEKKKGLFYGFITGFIRIKGVGNWLLISFFGFLLGSTSLDITESLIPLVFFLVSTFFILSFTFSINNYYDIDTDRNNPRRAALNILASGVLSKRTGMLLNIIFVIIPLVLSVFYSWQTLIFCGFLIALMWMYSAPPLRLKGRAGLDIVWHFIAFFALVLWGSYLAGAISSLGILVAVSFGMFGCFAQIDNHVHDYPFDKASGSKTFAVWIGLDNARSALKLAFVLYIVSLLPLIALFSLYIPLTVLILAGGIIGSLVAIKIKKSTGASSLFHIITWFGCAVYLNCLVYHIGSLL